MFLLKSYCIVGLPSLGSPINSLYLPRVPSFLVARFYLDRSGAEFGPFRSDKMRAWPGGPDARARGEVRETKGPKHPSMEYMPGLPKWSK